MDLNFLLCRLVIICGILHFSYLNDWLFKMLFVAMFVLFRSPDTSRVKAKMIYASSKDRFRRELDGVHYELQATDPTEMDMEVIKERAK